MSVAIGDKAPDFQLPDTEGASWSAPNGDGATATVVVFTCNHCPYALAWHDRITQAARDYADRGVRFLAINSNDAERYPRDSYDAMKARVAKEDWPMPYLYDADAGGRARVRRQDHAGPVRGRLRGSPALPRRARLRL